VTRRDVLDGEKDTALTQRSGLYESRRAMSFYGATPLCWSDL